VRSAQRRRCGLRAGGAGRRATEGSRAGPMPEGWPPGGPAPGGRWGSCSSGDVLCWAGRRVRAAPARRESVSGAAGTGDSAGRRSRADRSRAGTRGTCGASTSSRRSPHQCTIRACPSQARRASTPAGRPRGRALSPARQVLPMTTARPCRQRATTNREPRPPPRCGRPDRRTHPSSRRASRPERG